MDFAAMTPSERCPHCGALAVIEPRGEGADLSWVCGVCAGPRMPAGLGGEAALVPLREAKLHRGKATRSRAASWVFAVMATFMTLVAVAAWPAAFVAKLILLVLALTPTSLALRARARVSRASTAAEAAMDRAWLAAAEDVASRAKSGVTAAELAKALKIDEARADRLLTELAVNDRTRVDVGDDAEVRFSVAPSEALRAKLRVDAADTTNATDADSAEATHEEGAIALEDAPFGKRAARGTPR